MELDYYREFAELAKTLNFREAAANLCISPSALSKHVRALESRYQLQLFARDRRRVSLTPAGAVLLDHARAICSACDDAAAAMAEAHSNRPLILAGVVEGADEQQIMLEAMRDIRNRGIGRQVRVHATGNLDVAEQAAALRNGQHGCFVSYELDDLGNDPDIGVVSLCNLPLDVVVSTGNALARKDEVSLADLSGASFIHLSGPYFTPIWQRIEEKLRAFGVPHTTRPVPAESVYDYFNLDLGASVLAVPHRPVMDMYSSVPQMGAKVLPVAEPGFCLGLDAAYLKSAEDDALRTVIDALKAAFRPA